MAGYRTPPELDNAFDLGTAESGSVFQYLQRNPNQVHALYPDHNLPMHNNAGAHLDSTNEITDEVIRKHPLEPGETAMDFAKRAMGKVGKALPLTASSGADTVWHALERAVEAFKKEEAEDLARQFVATGAPADYESMQTFFDRSEEAALERVQAKVGDDRVLPDSVRKELFYDSDNNHSPYQVNSALMFDEYFVETVRELQR